MHYWINRDILIDNVKLFCSMPNFYFCMQHVTNFGIKTLNVLILTDVKLSWYVSHIMCGESYTVNDENKQVLRIS